MQGREVGKVKAGWRVSAGQYAGKEEYMECLSPTFPKSRPVLCLPEMSMPEHKQNEGRKVLLSYVKCLWGKEEAEIWRKIQEK